MKKIFVSSVILCFLLYASFTPVYSSCDVRGCFNLACCLQAGCSGFKDHCLSCPVGCFCNSDSECIYNICQIASNQPLAKQCLPPPTDSKIPPIGCVPEPPGGCPAGTCETETTHHNGYCCPTTCAGYGYSNPPCQPGSVPTTIANCPNQNLQCCNP